MNRDTMRGMKNELTYDRLNYLIQFVAGWSTNLGDFAKELDRDIMAGLRELAEIRARQDKSAEWRKIANEPATDDEIEMHKRHEGCGGACLQCMDKFRLIARLERDRADRERDFAHRQETHDMLQRSFNRVHARMETAESRAVILERKVERRDRDIVNLKKEIDRLADVMRQQRAEVVEHDAQLAHVKAALAACHEQNAALRTDNARLRGIRPGALRTPYGTSNMGRFAGWSSPVTVEEYSEKMEIPLVVERDEALRERIIAAIGPDTPTEMRWRAGVAHGEGLDSVALAFGLKRRVRKCVQKFNRNGHRMLIACDEGRGVNVSYHDQPQPRECEALRDICLHHEPLWRYADEDARFATQPEATEYAREIVVNASGVTGTEPETITLTIWPRGLCTPEFHAFPFSTSDGQTATSDGQTYCQCGKARRTIITTTWKPETEHGK